MDMILARSLLAGLFFGIWPIISKFSGLPQDWVAVMATFGAFVVSLVNLHSPLPAIKSAGIGFSGGLLQGVAMVLYGSVIAAKAGEVSKYYPVVGIMIFSVPFLAGILLLHEHFTLRKLLALLFGCLTIYFLAYPD